MGGLEAGASPGDRSLLAQGSSFQGLVVAAANARIDGRLTGEVVAGHRLVLGETAEVRARVEAEEVIVDGRLEGEVHARRRLQLGSRAQVRGVLRSPRVALADGCRFDGRLEMPGCHAVEHPVADSA